MHTPIVLKNSYNEINLEEFKMKKMEEREMKKIWKIALFIVLMIPLSSCFNTNRRINYFIPGCFIGYNEYNNTQTCYFNVEEITKNSFQEANGVNVIHDLVSNKFYSLEFYVIDHESNQYTIDFINLKDAYNGAKGTPIAYQDEHQNWIIPFGGMVSEKEENYYNIHITNEDFEIYTYLSLNENNS